MDESTSNLYLTSVQNLRCVLLIGYPLIQNSTYFQEVTLTGGTDGFFAQQRLATFGDLGGELKQHVQAYQQRSVAQTPGAISSIADMKRFVEEYPEIRRLGGNVSKHVAIVGELSRLVERDHLLEVGEVEQGLATSGSDFRVRVPHLPHIRGPLMCLLDRARVDDQSGDITLAQTATGYALCSQIPKIPGKQHRLAHQPYACKWSDS
jgi:hypothetical protein